MYPRTNDVAVMLGRCLPGTRGVFEYWDSKRGERRMPARRDIDPLEMRPWLAGMQLIDVSHNPRRMVYRLVGERDVTFRGQNPTGRSVEEFCIGFNRDETLRNFDIVISDGVPLYDWADYLSQSGYPRSQETLMLPLSDDDNLVNMVLTFAEVDIER